MARQGDGRWRALGTGLAALVAAGSCATAGGRAAREPGGDAALARALDAAVAGPGAREGLRAEVECETVGGYRSAVVFEGGVGIWDGARQFVLDGPALLSVLETFRRHRFPELRETYGGREDPRRPEPPAALRVTCTAALRLGGTARRVTQLEKGRQSPELKQLARRVLTLCEKAARRGKTVASLAEGLQRLATAELAAEALALSSHHKPERADASGESGWLLHLEGRRLLTRAYTGDGYGEPLAYALPAEDVRSLSRLLLESEVAAMPPNLEAAGYTDLEVRVLDHKRGVQARRFAGLDPAGQSGARAAFERVHQAVQALHRRVLREGRPAEPR
jgi:hypothetical protein